MYELEMKKGTFSEFREELMSIVEEERLSAEAPKVPLVTPLEQTKIERSLPENVKTHMSYFYHKLQASEHQQR
jgi:hypothetical protein